MEATVTPGHALQLGVQLKLSSSFSACRSVRMDFIPLMAETLGGLVEDTVTTISAIGKAISAWTGYTCTSSTKHLFGRIAIALWHGNASQWLHRQPSLPPMAGADSENLEGG